MPRKKATMQKVPTKKVSTKKAAAIVEAKNASPAGDTEYAPRLRTLAAGTTVFLPDSTTPIRLYADAHVLGEGIEKDQKWVGMLARDPTNWELNIGSVEGTWSPVTCTRQDEPVVESVEA